MNTGQTMLTIFALALLSIITLNYYRSMGESGNILSKSSATFTATTVATSYLERVEGCAFDEWSDTIGVQVPDSTKFTVPGSLGPDAGESILNYEQFDDIDDFNKDTITYSPGWNNELYKVYFRIYYVNPWTDMITELTGGSTSFLKRIDVKVWRSFPPADSAEVIDTVKMSSLHGFYFYNPI